MTTTETKTTDLAPGYGAAKVQRLIGRWSHQVAIDLGDGAFEMSPRQARRLAALLVEAAAPKTEEG